MQKLVSYRGKIETEGRFSIEAFSRSYLFGETIFTTFRLFNGTVLFLHDHMERLRSGVEWLFGDIVVNANIGIFDEILDGLASLHSHCRNGDWIVRINIFQESNGREYVGTAESLGFSIHVAQNVISKQTSFLALDLMEYNGRFWPAWVKIGMCADRIYDVKKTKSKGYSGPLYYANGEILEGATSNIFFVNEDRELVTPALRDGILDGVTRRHYLNFFNKRGIPCSIRPVCCDELVEFAGAFLVNSVTPFNFIGKIGIHEYHEGSFDYQKLAKEFGEYSNAFISRLWTT